MQVVAEKVAGKPFAYTGRILHCHSASLLRKGKKSHRQGEATRDVSQAVITIQLLQTKPGQTKRKTHAHKHTGPTAVAINPFHTLRPVYSYA